MRMMVAQILALRHVRCQIMLMVHQMFEQLMWMAMVILMCYQQEEMVMKLLGMRTMGLKVLQKESLQLMLKR